MVGICGSDVHRFLADDYGSTTRYPVNSGHEYCGRVLAVGEDVSGFRAGDRVTLGHNWAGGDYGAFSQAMRVPQADDKLFRVPDDMSDRDTAMIEPLLVALDAFHRTQPQTGQSALILGAGTIGLLLLQVCVAYGVGDLRVSEVSPRRKAIAAELGPAVVDPGERPLESVMPEGVDVCYECAGTPETMEQAFRLTRREGRVGMVAHYGRNTRSIDPEWIVRERLAVNGSGVGLQYYEEAIQLLRAGQVVTAPLITHVLPLEQAKRGFELASEPDEAIKVLLEP